VTPAVKWLTRLRDKWLGNFYEGPEPPQRLREIVVVFANLHSRATRAEWLEFAAAHAEEAYRCGYVRGFENAERDPDPIDVPPERLADQMDPSWRWQPNVLLTDPLGIVQGEPLPDNVVNQRFLDGLSPRRREL